MIQLLQAGPLPEVDPNAAASGLTDALKAGGVVLAIIFGGLLLIWLLRIFLIPNLKGKALAWASTILISVAAGLGVMALDPTNYVAAAMVLMSSGLAAGKAWDLMPDGTKKNGKPTLKEKMKATVERRRMA